MLNIKIIIILVIMKLIKNMNIAFLINSYNEYLNI